MKLAELERAITKPVAHTATIWTFDIERLPIETYQWSPRNRSGYTPEAMVIKPSEMISFAAKRQDGLIAFSSTFHHGKDAMLKTLHKIMDSADIMVGYNNKRFDVRHCNAELVTARYSRPKPSKQVDLLRIIKQQFEFDYNTLGSVTKRMQIDTKAETGGFDLWKRCIAGDPEAWDTMKRYNIRDVVVTDLLRQRIASWIPNNPNMGLFVGGGHVCVNCGSGNLAHHGSVITGVTMYPAYQCQDCGAWCRSKHRQASADMHAVAI